MGSQISKRSSTRRHIWLKLNSREDLMLSILQATAEYDFKRKEIVELKHDHPKYLEV